MCIRDRLKRRAGPPSGFPRKPAPELRRARFWHTRAEPAHAPRYAGHPRLSEELRRQRVAARFC
eukprot:7311430-Alexandrium_andersonii.AAC.1